MCVKERKAKLGAWKRMYKFKPKNFAYRVYRDGRKEKLSKEDIKELYEFLGWEAEDDRWY